MYPWKWPEKSSSKALFLFNHGWKFSSSVSMEAWGWCFYNILFHLLPCFISACNYFHYWTNSSCEICTSIPRKKKKKWDPEWWIMGRKLFSMWSTHVPDSDAAGTEPQQDTVLLLRMRQFLVHGLWTRLSFTVLSISWEPLLLSSLWPFLCMTSNKDLKTQLLTEVSINTETDCVSYGWDLCRTIFFSRVVYQSGLLSSKVRIGSN